MADYENNESQEEQAEGAEGGAGDGTEGSEDLLLESDKPRNNTMLLYAGLLLMGAGMIWFMKMRAGPKPAAASADAASATETINQFLTDGDKNITAMREMLRNTEKIVQQFVNHPQTPDLELETNPFKLLRGKATPKVDEEAERLRKLAEAREAEKQEIMRLAGAMRVQSIIGGKTPTCMINSKMYVEGQEVEGFLIEKIKPGSVVVKQKEYKFELKISKDTW